MGKIFRFIRTYDGGVRVFRRASGRTTAYGDSRCGGGS